MINSKIIYLRQFFPSFWNLIKKTNKQANKQTNKQTNKQQISETAIHRNPRSDSCLKYVLKERNHVS